ncbi:hypothetical protein HAX54_019181 [Datura stramonium]|uniref:Secreted protein n=1 Tax=Datura stramonium TaxID=4076 RepID=A0ABS8UQY8_DATST|nr:hypothetical protein [Datura stramonium]
MNLTWDLKFLFLVEVLNPFLVVEQGLPRHTFHCRVAPTIALGEGRFAHAITQEAVPRRAPCSSEMLAPRACHRTTLGLHHASSRAAVLRSAICHDLSIIHSNFLIFIQ